MVAVRPVIQYNLNRDVHTLQEMAARLDPFIYENETYGFMPEGLPKLTIGGLLMRSQRLTLLSNLLSDEQRKTLNSAQQQLVTIKQAWLTAYTNRVAHELALHINELRQFLDDCGQDQDACREMYPSVVEKRVLAEILVSEARELNAQPLELENGLHNIDLHLQGLFKPGHFIWDKRLLRAYPKDQYGFLYVSM